MRVRPGVPGQKAPAFARHRRRRWAALQRNPKSASKRAAAPEPTRRDGASATLNAQPSPAVLALEGVPLLVGSVGTEPLY